MPKSVYLPAEALPGLIALMGTFKNALRSQMESFEKTGDTITLGSTIAKFRRDLIHFNENFEYLHQNAETNIEYQLLDEFAKELGEAQELLCKAKKMLNKML